jgi:ketosteroid isomerase-like protein
VTSPATMGALKGHAQHLGRDFDAWVGLFADDAILEFPHFASLGWPTETRGRDSIRAGLGPFLESVDDFFLQNVRVYEAADPDTVFAEYEVHARVKATGRRYDQSYFAMLTARNRKIVRPREFPDTIAVARHSSPKAFRHSRRRARPAARAPTATKDRKHEQAVQRKGRPRHWRLDGHRARDGAPLRGRGCPGLHHGPTRGRARRRSEGDRRRRRPGQGGLEQARRARPPFRDHFPEAGKLDVVFANAGGGSIQPIAAITEEQFDDTFGRNVTGVVFTVQKSLPLLVDGGSVILTGSTAGSVGMPGLSVYAACKAAVRNLARTCGHSS